MASSTDSQLVDRHLLCLRGHWTTPLEHSQERRKAPGDWLEVKWITLTHGSNGFINICMDHTEIHCVSSH